MTRSPREANAAPAALADLHLGEDAGELAADRAGHGAGDLHDRGVEALTGLDADGEHVERVGEALGQLLLALGAHVVDEEVGEEEPEDAGADGDDEAADRQAEEDDREEGEQGQADGLGRHDPLEVPPGGVARLVEGAQDPAGGPAG